MKRLVLMIGVALLTTLSGIVLAQGYYRFFETENLPRIEVSQVTSARTLPVNVTPQPSSFTLHFKGFSERQGEITAEFQLTNNNSEVAYYRTAKHHSNCSVALRRGEEIIDACPCCIGGGFGVLSVAAGESEDFWGVDLEGTSFEHGQNLLPLVVG
jgi:hypothetical protein